jgi:hypothetical protein
VVHQLRGQVGRGPRCVSWLLPGVPRNSASRSASRQQAILTPYLLLCENHNRIDGPFIMIPLCNPPVDHANSLTSVTEKYPFIWQFDPCHIRVVRTSRRDNCMEECFVPDRETVPFEARADIREGRGCNESDIFRVCQPCKYERRGNGACSNVSTTGDETLPRHYLGYMDTLLWDEDWPGGLL